ncbi:hypothetical protein RCH18_001565 [Flavobacterium sp. PL11]|jgi:hypothetical protein|uniref:DUF4296 domain-containing protein n=1 Tax=Flavobacterium sp. PL11 TaxID=3071717 RepID=UPI002E028907|nr:hypothetical protein [Flavobacterium sp. PL11]
MRKSFISAVILMLLISCTGDLVKKPKRLIDKDVMVNIMYDISILEGIKYQNPTSLDSFKINATDYIFKKYKVDSLQFVKSNVYYSADYKEYKILFDQVEARIEMQKVITDSLIKLEEKKAKEIKKVKLKKAPLLVADTLYKEKVRFIKKNLVKKSVIKEQPLQ